MKGAAKPVAGAASLSVLLEEALVAEAAQYVACGVCVGAGELADPLVGECLAAGSAAGP